MLVLGEGKSGLRHPTIVGGDRLCLDHLLHAIPQGGQLHLLERIWLSLHHLPLAGHGDDADLHRLTPPIDRSIGVEVRLCLSLRLSRPGRPLLRPINGEEPLLKHSGILDADEEVPPSWRSLADHHLALFTGVEGGDGASPLITAEDLHLHAGDRAAVLSVEGVDDRIVLIHRDLVQQSIALTDHPLALAVECQPVVPHSRQTEGYLVADPACLTRRSCIGGQLRRTTAADLLLHLMVSTDEVEVECLSRWPFYLDDRLPCVEIDVGHIADGGAVPKELLAHLPQPLLVGVPGY